MQSGQGSRRPAESAFKQQKLKAWQPILTPKWVIGCFTVVGTVFIPIGIAVLLASKSVLEYSIPYGANTVNCPVRSYTQPCIVSFTLPNQAGWSSQEVFVYYELDNFYQNHRRYVQSRAALQLSGDDMKLNGGQTDDLQSVFASFSDCQGFVSSFSDQTPNQTNTFYTAPTVYMYPCGLVAGSRYAANNLSGNSSFDATERADSTIVFTYKGKATTASWKGGKLPVKASQGQTVHFEIGRAFCRHVASPANSSSFLPQHTGTEPDNREGHARRDEQSVELAIICKSRAHGFAWHGGSSLRLERPLVSDGSVNSSTFVGWRCTQPTLCSITEGLCSEDAQLEGISQQAPSEGILKSAIFASSLILFIDDPTHLTNNEMMNLCPRNPSGVAWPSDVAKKFAAPTVKWIAHNCRYIGGIDSGWIDPQLWNGSLVKLVPVSACNLQPSDFTGPSCGYRVYSDIAGSGTFTPNKGIYNCWQNVSDEDFIVWMRVAALPTFKKLYRKIPQVLLLAYKYVPTGNNFEVQNRARYNQMAFGGKKSIVLSTTTWIGGKNDFLGSAYIAVGAICIGLALVFLAKHLISPRKLGDPTYLDFNK